MISQRQNDLPPSNFEQPGLPPGGAQPAMVDMPVPSLEQPPQPGV